jgi:hypothetical protein
VGVNAVLFAIGGVVLGAIASVAIYAAAQPAEHAAPPNQQISYGSR